LFQFASVIPGTYVYLFGVDLK